jgi:uncharacterized protein YceK
MKKIVVFVMILLCLTGCDDKPRKKIPTRYQPAPTASEIPTRYQPAPTD